MFEFEITFDDQEPILITADMRDVARWEMNGDDRSITDFETKRLPVSVLYELAYYALKRQKLFDGSIDDLLDAANLVPTSKASTLPKATRKGRISTRS